MNTNAAIIIPARYGSTRFAGKPLALIGGVAMLEHVYNRACEAVQDLGAQDSVGNNPPHITICVATDDSRIMDFCAARAIPAVMTSESCRTGSDRVLEAAEILSKTLPAPIDIILNLQGDNPFASKHAIRNVLACLIAHPEAEVATPIIALDWDGLDAMRAQKQTTPHSGTTAAVMRPHTPNTSKTEHSTTPMTAPMKALWFSKQILPAIRKEADLRAASPLSPVYRHIGLYGYRLDALRRFNTLPEGYYEALEGLEQLRFLENGIGVYCVEIPSDSMPPLSGIDTEDDLKRAQAMLDAGLIHL